MQLYYRLQKKNWIGLNLYLESWNAKVFCTHMPGVTPNTQRGKAASFEVHECGLWREETYKADKTTINFCWKQNSFLNRTPSRPCYRNKYLNSTEKLCKLYSPRRPRHSVLAFPRACFAKFSLSVKSGCSNYDKRLSPLAMRCQIPRTRSQWLEKDNLQCCCRWG